MEILKPSNRFKYKSGWINVGGKPVGRIVHHEIVVENKKGKLKFSTPVYTVDITYVPLTPWDRFKMFFKRIITKGIHIRFQQDD